MRPRVDEVMHSISWTFEEYIVPEVKEPFAQSLAYTIGNLLRHVEARVEHEGRFLTEDIEDLVGLLGSSLEFLPEAGANQEVSAAIAEALEAEATPPGHYQNSVELSARVEPLRAALAAVIRTLEEGHAKWAERADYIELRRRIRTHLDKQLTAESLWTAAPFREPRR